MKKPSKSYLTRKLDKIVSEIVRARGYCVRCENRKTLQAAHIFSRSNRAVRWRLGNVLCLCAKCHFWSHLNPVLFTEWVRKWLGATQYNILKNNATQIKKWTIEEMEELYKRFETVRGGECYKKNS